MNNKEEINLPLWIDLPLRIFFVTFMTMLVIGAHIWVYEKIGLWVFAPHILIMWILFFYATICSEV